MTNYENNNNIYANGYVYKNIIIYFCSSKC